MIPIERRFTVLPPEARAREIQLSASPPEWADSKPEFRVTIAFGGGIGIRAPVCAG